MKIFWRLAVGLGAAALAAGSLAQSTFTEVKGSREFTGQMIVKPLSPSQLEAKGLTPELARLKALQSWLQVEKQTIDQNTALGFAVVTLKTGQTENSYASQLMKSGLYEYVIPNYKYYSLKTPNDPMFTSQWQHVNLQSTKAWDLFTGSGATVAVCDTGVDQKHPDLKSQLLPGYNAPTRTRQVDGGDVDDLNGHGTHVAGCATAHGNNGIGVVGVAWNNPILPCKIVSGGDGTAYYTDMVAAVTWAADNGAKVINLSFGGVENQIMQDAGAYARTKGALFFMAGGNFQEYWSGFDWPDVVVVGATNSADQKADFSAYGRAIDVVAPGVDILSTIMGQTYASESGTSMASPIAAGVASLIKGYNPALSPTDVASILFASCDVIGSSDTYGNGRVNSYKALLLAKTTLTHTASFAPSKASLIYGTMVSGNLASLAAADSSYYVMKSSAVTGAGQVAGVTTTTNLAPVAKIASFNMEVSARGTSSQSTVLSLFLRNYSTGKDDLVSSVPLTTSDSKISYAVSVGSMAKYMSSTGEVRAIARAYAADSRLSGVSGSFQFKVDKLAITANVLN